MIGSNPLQWESCRVLGGRTGPGWDPGQCSTITLPASPWAQHERRRGCFGCTTGIPSLLFFMAFPPCLPSSGQSTEMVYLSKHGKETPTEDLLTQSHRVSSSIVGLQTTNLKQLIAGEAAADPSPSVEPARGRSQYLRHWPHACASCPQGAEAGSGTGAWHMATQACGHPLGACLWVCGPQHSMVLLQLAFTI